MTNHELTPQGAFLLYQTEDAKTRIEVRFSEGEIWLTQQQLADLFQSSVQNITQHIRFIYETSELIEGATCKPYLQVREENTRKVSRSLKHYNLDMVIAVGYRVRSHRGTQFRRWATELLKSYLIEGVALDDARFKTGEDSAYFERLLARIRDIRSSEKEFWKKVLAIFATSIDYDAKTNAAQTFFATVQNKMHWAVHGHTASELVNLRVNATLPNLGLTNWSGQAKGLPIREADVVVAKNFLNADELDALNRIVMAYIEVADLQAQAKKSMTMKDWAVRLDGFLQMTEKEILTHAGKISAEAAKEKAKAAFTAYHQRLTQEITAVERDFEKAIAKPLARSRVKKR